MFSSLSGNPHARDDAYRMVQLGSVLLIPAFHRSSARGDPAVGRAHELHRGVVKGEEIVPTGVFVLGAAKGDAAHVRAEVGRDFAGVDGPGEKS